ncbi:MAG: nucleotidyltransferase domain-containing protein [candidate division WOR-3 bacterium]
MDKNQLKKIIRRYRDQLKDMGICVDRIILFGSQARGTAKEPADIDLLVISDDFAGMSLLERLELLGVAAARILEPIEAMGMTNQEWKEERFPFFKAAAREGTVYK